MHTQGISRMRMHATHGESLFSPSRADHTNSTQRESVTSEITIPLRISLGKYHRQKTNAIKTRKGTSLYAKQRAANANTYEQVCCQNEVLNLFQFLHNVPQFFQCQRQPTSKT